MAMFLQITRAAGRGPALGLWHRLLRRPAAESGEQVHSAGLPPTP